MFSQKIFRRPLTVVAYLPIILTVHLSRTIEPLCGLAAFWAAKRSLTIRLREPARGCGMPQGMTHPCGNDANRCHEFFESCREATIRRFLFTGPERKRGVKQTFLKGLILAQNERWRRGLGTQVERIPGGLLPGGSGERGSKAWVTYPGVRHSRPNGRVIPGDVTRSPDRVTKGLPPWEGPTWY